MNFPPSVFFFIKIVIYNLTDFRQIEISSGISFLVFSVSFSLERIECEYKDFEMVAN